MNTTVCLSALRPTPALPLKAHISPLAFQVQSRRRHLRRAVDQRSSAFSTSATSPAPAPAASSPTLSQPSTADPRTPPPKPIQPLTPTQRTYLDSALRVNHAGELAATLIYAGQTPLVTRAHPHLRPLMKHMSDQETGHLHTFNKILSHHRVRPTALVPIWSVLSTGLGWATGVLGREAAMACTEAVETEIGEHYNSQVRELTLWAEEAGSKGMDLPVEVRELTQEIRRIRDDELEHLDHAVEHDAKLAKPYELLTSVIRGGCRGAIWASERV